MATQIFVSYAHEDSPYLADDSLVGHVRGVERDGAKFWTDQKIPVGAKWDDEIKTALADADIAMVLVEPGITELGLRPELRDSVIPRSVSAPRR